MNLHEQLCTPAGVQALAKEWWACDVPAETAEKLSAQYIKKRKKPYEKNVREGKATSALSAGQLVWLKYMLNIAGLLPVGNNPVTDDTPTPVTAVMHVGFLTLAETEEMMWLLRNERPRENTNTPARSKIFETAQIRSIAPIDATAAIVSQIEKEEK
jgi:hypothetical protein